MIDLPDTAFGSETIRQLPALGVSAQSLHYLNFLIAEPVQAAAIYRSGVLVQIPRPERYAIHKLIVADRRNEAGDGRLKAEKDRQQAAFLIETLAEDRPDDLRRAYTAAMDAGPRWRKHIESSMKRLASAAGVLRGVG